MTQGAPRVASPISTGGAGPTFEQRVGACYLAAALAGVTPYGQAGGVARALRFQRLYEGEPLDDLIVDSELPTGAAKLALQIKRDLDFTANNTTFDAVLRACWSTFRSQKFIQGIDRFGVVLGLYDKVVEEHYRAVLEWARASKSAKDFSGRIQQPRLTSENQRAFHSIVTSKLSAYSEGAATSDDVWSFLRHMVLLHFDVEREESLSRDLALAQIRRVLPVERTDRAATIFDALTRYSANANKSAGSLSGTEVRAQLLSEGQALLDAPEVRQDLRRLSDEARNARRRIRSDIGGMALNRAEIVARAVELQQAGGLVEIVGPRGAGKSNVLNALATRQEEMEPLILLSGERLNSLSGLGWSAVARDLNLDNLLSVILSAHGSTRPALFIDGVDRIVTPSPREAVNDLVRTVAEVQATGGPRWTIVITSREENLGEVHDWLAWQELGTPVTLQVPELRQEELGYVAERFPRLAPLLRQPHLKPVLANPFLLSIVVDPRVLGTREVPPIATEVEIRDAWWERVIGGGIEGRERQLALLAFGRRSASSPGTPVVADGSVSGNFLRALERDSVLIREEGRDAHRFSHDVYEDWVLSRVLDQWLNEMPLKLRELREPLGLLRPVQLASLALLERTSDSAQWIQLLEQFGTEAELRPRWRQALLLTPLLSARAVDLLDAAAPALMMNNAALLSELLRAVRTTAVLPTLEYLPAAARLARDDGELISLLLSEPVPVVRIWLPLIQWLSPRLAEIPGGARVEASQVMLIWQRSTPVGSPFRKEIGQAARAWLESYDEPWLRMDERWVDPVDDDVDYDEDDE